MYQNRSQSNFKARQERLRALMETRNVPSMLVTNLPNIRYLTGFTGTAGVLLIGPRAGTLWVDPRYTLQAKEQSDGVEVIEEKNGILKGAAARVAKSKVSAVAFEGTHLSYSQFEALRTDVGDSVKVSPAGELIEELRVVKDRSEIDAIRRAGQVTAEVFKEMLPRIRPGALEQDLAAEVEFRMRKKGAEGAAFETIVASGTRSAYPHARPSAKALQECEFVIFDLGAILGGYAADMTRTVYLGEPTRRVRSLYYAVLKSQEAAIAAVRDSTTCGEVDSVARKVLAKQGLAKYFTHSTGHGVGLEIHELPRLGKAATAALRSGSVITIEPGIYLEGFGGIRIEDTVLVGPDGPEVLTPASKELFAIK